MGPPSEFYNSALMFLAYTPVDDMAPQSRYMLATDMALASIAADDIFNFGDVIATPILNYLKGTPNAWLFDIVMALNKGDIDGFNMVVDSNREKYYSQSLLSAKHEVVKQKVALLSLVNLAFERPSHDRLISFSDIASHTRLSLDQVGVSGVFNYLMSVLYDLFGYFVRDIGFSGRMGDYESDVCGID
jgi:26S proteasome regulatory subunit N9